MTRLCPPDMAHVPYDPDIARMNPNMHELALTVRGVDLRVCVEISDALDIHHHQLMARPGDRGQTSGQKVRSRVRLKGKEQCTVG